MPSKRNHAKWKLKVLDLLRLNPNEAAVWFKIRNDISELQYDNVCVDRTTSTEKASKLLSILDRSPWGLNALLSYLREQNNAALAAEIEDEIKNDSCSSNSMAIQLPRLIDQNGSAACKFISELKQFTRQNCEVIRQHWKDNLAVDDLEHAYVPLTIANEKELSPKYTWNHDDLQNLDFLYVDEVRIFITGEPGFGKSTFLNKIAYDWATGKNSALTKHFDFVYYLPLSEATGNSLSEAILAYLAFEDKRTSSAVISRCFNDYRSRTLFLLDAYDEANLTNFSALSRIAEGRENGLAKCVITSRPLQVTNFPKPIHISARGFDTSAQADYITKHVHDAGRRAHILGQTLELLKSPFFLTVVCLLANHNKTFNFEGTSALFELLKEYHGWLRAKAVENKKMQISVDGYRLTLIEAGKFALQEMLHSGDLTEEREWAELLEGSVGSSSDHMLREHAAQLGVMTVKTVRGVANPRVVYGFLHKLLAEYLCAVYLNHLISSTEAPWRTSVTYTGMPAEMLPRLLLADYGHFRMVSYFLSGLSKDYFDAVVQHLLTMSENTIEIPRLCDTFEMPQCKPRITRGRLGGRDRPNTAVSTTLLAALLSGGSADKSIQLKHLYLQSGWLSTAVQCEKLVLLCCTLPGADESWQMKAACKLVKVELFRCAMYSFHFLQHLPLQKLILEFIDATDEAWLQLFAALRAGLSAFLEVLQLRTEPPSATVVGPLPAALAHMQVLRHLYLDDGWYSDGLLATIQHDLSGTLEVLMFHLPDHREQEKALIKEQLTQACTKLKYLCVD